MQIIAASVQVLILRLYVSVSYLPKMLWWHGICGDRINGIQGLPWSKTYLSLYNHRQPLFSHSPSVSLNYLVFLLDVLLFLTSRPVLMWSPLYRRHCTSLFIQLSPAHPQVSLHEDLKASFSGLTRFADGMYKKGKKWNEFKVWASGTRIMGFLFIETGKTGAL